MFLPSVFSYVRLPSALLLLSLATVATISACSSQSDSANGTTGISQNEVVALTGSYLESKEGPPVLLWDDVGAPAFFPQSCAEFLAFDSEDRNRTVQSEENGSFLVTLVNSQEGRLDETYRWRLEPETGEVTSLQETC